MKLQHLTYIAMACSLSACWGGDDPKTATPNQAPAVDAGADLSVNERSTVTINATASDSDGSVSAYAWSQSSGEAVTLNGDNSAQLSFMAPSVEMDTSLTFSVTVTDDDGATATDSVVVNVSNTESKGVLLDSPVINISYQTETLSGVTDENGQYEYIPGETVTFHVGDLIFPSANAFAILTPLDLANTSDTSDPEVINIIRLLQSLDQDGATENGITITQTAKDNARQVDFTLSVAEFASSPSVLSVVSNGGQDNVINELIDSQTAVSHFESQLMNSGTAFGSIVGSWLFAGDEFVTLTLTNEGIFLWNEANGEAPNGMEAGHYNYDATTQTITLMVDIMDGNGDGGISQSGNADGSGLSFTQVQATSSALNLVIPEEGTLSATKINALNNNVVGTYFYGDDEVFALTLLADGRFMWHEALITNDNDELQTNGMEAGHYNYDSQNQTLSFVADIYDDANGGVQEGNESLTFTKVAFSNDAISFVIGLEGDDPIVLSRVRQAK